MLRLLWIFIAKLILLMLVFTLVMQHVLPWPWFVALGFAGAFLVINANVSFDEAAAISKDVQCIRCADETKVGMDGERFAAVGVLRTVGAPLRAPFSNKECVYYRYTALGAERNNETGKPGIGEYSGLAFTQCAVRSATREIRLIGVPVLNGFEEEQEALVRDEHYDNAEAYVNATSFETVSMEEMIGRVHRIKESFKDEAGQVRRDLRLDVARAIRDLVLREIVVEPGVEVCVVGTWSSKHGGLIQNLGTRRMLSLYEGGTESATRSLEESRRRYVTNGVVSLAFAAGLLVWGAVTW